MVKAPSVSCSRGRHAACRVDEWACSCSCHSDGAIPASLSLRGSGDGGVGVGPAESNVVVPLFAHDVQASERCEGPAAALTPSGAIVDRLPVAVAPAGPVDAVVRDLVAVLAVLDEYASPNRRAPGLDVGQAEMLAQAWARVQQVFDELSVEEWLMCDVDVPVADPEGAL